jgi:uncharacterized protein (TIGR02118 family)
MISVTILYPYSADKKFDWDYYMTSHLSLIKSKLGNSVKSFTIEKGLNGSDPSQPPAYIAVSRLVFENKDDLASFIAFRPQARADSPNYTDIVPITQINEVMPT